jgi:hypothetical protein
MAGFRGWVKGLLRLMLALCWTKDHAAGQGGMPFVTIKAKRQNAVALPIPRQACRQPEWSSPDT